MHKWVCSFDLNSLYPHLIMQYNISPDTYIEVVDVVLIRIICLNKQVGDEFEKLLRDQKMTMCPNGVLFSKKTTTTTTTLDSLLH